MIILLGILYWISLYNYLLFHSLAEIFSILIAAVIFIIAWNARKFITNNFLIFLGVAYLFVALLDLLHTLGFKGMEIFLDYDYYANQLWIAARYLESISFLAAFLYLKRKKIHENTRIVSTFPIHTILHRYSESFRRFPSRLESLLLSQLASDVDPLLLISCFTIL